MLRPSCKEEISVLISKSGLLQSVSALFRSFTFYDTSLSFSRYSFYLIRGDWRGIWQRKPFCSFILSNSTSLHLLTPVVVIKQPYEQEMVDVDGLQINTLKMGSIEKPPLILIHGFGSGIGQWVCYARIPL